MRQWVGFVCACSVWLSFVMMVAAFSGAQALPATPPEADSVATPGETAPAQFGVGPTRFEVEISDKPVNETIRLVNVSKRDIAIEVTTANWILDESNNIQEVPPTPQSLDQWLVVNPLRFTLKPGETQSVRFSIRPREKPNPGEHRGMIFFSDVTPEVGSARGIRVSFRYGVAIYGHVGAQHPDAIIRDLGVNVPSRTLGIDIENTGDIHVRVEGQWAIWPAASFPGSEKTALLDKVGEKDFSPLPPVLAAGLLANTPVMPGYRRVVVSGLPLLPPGDYVLDVNAKVAAAIIDRSVPFRIEAPTPQKETPAALSQPRKD